jgi:LmbE family N-acetylglucosaminyl deacetylase
MLERLWSIGFRAAACAAPAAPAQWSSVGGRSVLIVAPHPDDEAIGCAGTALLHATAGDRVTVAIITDGRRSRVVADPAVMARVRSREAHQAARLMQVERLEWLGLPEGEWSAADLQPALVALLERIVPDIVYAPSRVDFHPEHFNVAHALALALGEYAQRARPAPRVRIYAVQVPLTPLMANLVADISVLQPRFAAVLQSYASQAASIACALRRRRYDARRYQLSAGAEEFCELSSHRYIELHRTPPREWSHPFRGLRSFPLTDPLAYLIGNAERRRLRAAFSGVAD